MSNNSLQQVYTSRFYATQKAPAQTDSESSDCENCKKIDGIIEEDTLEIHSERDEGTYQDDARDAWLTLRSSWKHQSISQGTY